MEAIVIFGAFTLLIIVGIVIAVTNSKSGLIKDDVDLLNELLREYRIRQIEVIDPCIVQGK